MFYNASVSAAPEFDFEAFDALVGGDRPTDPGVDDVARRHAEAAVWWRRNPGSLTSLVDRAEAAIDQLAAVDLATVDGMELGAGLVALQRLDARLLAVRCRLVEVFDAAKLYRADHDRSTATWLAKRTKAPRVAMASLVKLAHRLRKAPIVRGALARGELDRERVEVLSRNTESPREPVRSAFARDEAELVERASTRPYEELGRMLGYWKDTVDPDDAEAKAEKAHDQRRLHLSQSMDGMWYLDGLLDPVSGHEVATALERVYRELLDADWTQAREQHGPEVTVQQLARTPAQRRADALRELCRRATAAPPGSRLPQPLISVLVGYETLCGPIRETFNGTVLSPGQVASLLTEADVERVVFGPTSRDISDLGRRTRFFTAAQRRVIEIRDRTCWVPGCEEPAGFCDTDHVPPWSQGGATNVSCGRLGCEYHNRIDPPDQPDLFTHRDVPP
jgi:Domain of unknown function (DUF222)